MYDPQFKMIKMFVMVLVTLCLVAQIPNLIRMIIDTADLASTSISAEIASTEGEPAEALPPAEEPAETPVETSAEEAPPAVASFDPGQLWIGLGIIAGGAALVGGGVLIRNQVSKGKVARAERDALRSKLGRRWNMAHKTHATIASEYSAYLFDLNEILKRPALSDPTVTLTAQFVELYTLLGAPGKEDEERLSAQEVERYEELVAKTHTAWRAANAHAIKQGLGAFTSEEKRKVERARSLLALALDKGASEFERAQAYQQVKKLIDGLIHVTPAALTQIESGLKLMLTQGPDTSLETEQPAAAN